MVLATAAQRSYSERIIHDSSRSRRNMIPRSYSLSGSLSALRRLHHEEAFRTPSSKLRVLIEKFTVNGGGYELSCCCLSVLAVNDKMWQDRFAISRHGTAQAEVWAYECVSTVIRQKRSRRSILENLLTGFVDLVPPFLHDIRWRIAKVGRKLNALELNRVGTSL